MTPLEQDYGASIADAYDEIYAQRVDPELVATVLAGLARGAPALELGIGTGRVALPLAARGVPVSGIEISPAFLEQLRAKPGAELLPVMETALPDIVTDQRFGLIYSVASTLFDLPSQEDQQTCFRNVADHLLADGVFLVEAFVPDRSPLVSGDPNEPSSDGRLVLDSLREPKDQHAASKELVITSRGPRIDSFDLVYAWPEQLDAMAAAAGLRLRERWADWHGQSFTDTSPEHISVYERDTDGEARGYLS